MNRMLASRQAMSGLWEAGKRRAGYFDQLRARRSAAEPARALSWPSGHGDEFGVIHGSFAHLEKALAHVQKRRRPSFACRKVTEDGSRAFWLTIPELGSPVSLYHEPSIAADRIAIIADSAASPEAVARTVKQLLAGYRFQVEFYQRD